MHNKVLSLMIAFLLGTGLVFGSQEETASMEFKWAHLLDGTAPDMGIDIAAGADGVYFLSVAGSAAKYGNFNIYYDDALIADGAHYTGNGYNNNLSLVKTGFDGQLLWHVYTSVGDMMTNNGNVVARPDGSVVFSMVVRHTENMGTEPITLVDAAGKKTTIDWTLEADNASRYYKGLIVALSADGDLLWARLIDVSNAAQPVENAKATTSIALYLSSMTVDAAGRVYVAGRYVNPITLEMSGGTRRTLTPHNTEGWNGDSQVSRGDLFVARLDADGRVDKLLTTEGKATLETNISLTAVDDDILLYFNATGDNVTGDALLFAGSPIALDDNQPTMVLARLSADFTLRWVTVMNSAKRGTDSSVFQSCMLNVVDGEVWLTGLGKFNVPVALTTKSDNSPREAFVFKFDATSGKLTGATTNYHAFPTAAQTMSAYLGAFVAGGDDNVYLYGYAWDGRGVSIDVLDRETLAGVEQRSLILGGSMPTAQKMLVVDGFLYTLSRGRENNIESQRLHPAGTEVYLPTRDWAACYACFALPATPAAEGDVNGDGSVNAGDVSAVYNVMLGSETTADVTKRADVNGDGSVNAGDVSAVYAIMLK